MTKQEKIEKLLSYLDPSSMNYTEWVQVGQALHSEGYDVSVWDKWSQQDMARYHQGECFKKWLTFGKSGHGVTGATLIYLAKQHGYQVPYEELPFSKKEDAEDDLTQGEGFDAPIRAPRGRHSNSAVSAVLEATGSNISQEAAMMSMLTASSATPRVKAHEVSTGEAVDDEYSHKVYGYENIEEEFDEGIRRCELLIYLSNIFKPEEYVGYCVNTMMSSSGKKVPHIANYSRTAQEIMDSFWDTDTLEDVLGTLDDEAGAWIHFNPLDGHGVGVQNVTAFRYALIESDTMSLGDQERCLRELNIPVKFLTYSGNKSLHALVSIDAHSLEEYQRRVQLLHTYLANYGYLVDSQNKNPNRMTRMPGALRSGKAQCIVDMNGFGASSWEEWESSIMFELLDMPPLDCIDDVWEADIPQRPVLIEGILRHGHKMCVTGPSKSGKTFILLELAIALSRGLPWLGFQCHESKVLYINFELDRPSCISRVKNIVTHLGLDGNTGRNLFIWNLRGFAKPIEILSAMMMKMFKPSEFDAIILDPIYKIMSGDENNASQMGEFCNELDALARNLNCSIIYCHHHSKGAQNQKKVIDRSSGSGVFARDPDAIIDLLEVDLEEVSAEDKGNYHCLDSTTAWRLEGVLREFPSFAPKYLFFDYPVHEIDTSTFLYEVYHGKRKAPMPSLEAVETAGEGGDSTATGLSDEAFKQRVAALGPVNAGKKATKEANKVFMREVVALCPEGTSLVQLGKILNVTPRTARTYAEEENASMTISKGIVFPKTKGEVKVGSGTTDKLF